MKQSQLNTFFKQLSVADSSNVGANGVASTAEVQRPAHRPVIGQATPRAVAPTTQVKRPVHRRVKGQLPSSRDHSTYDSTKRCRTFQEGWKGSYSWVEHDKENNVMYFKPCREFQHLHPNPNISLIKGIWTVFYNVLIFISVIHLANNAWEYF